MTVEDTPQAEATPEELPEIIDPEPEPEAQPEPSPSPDEPEPEAPPQPLPEAPPEPEPEAPPQPLPEAQPDEPEPVKQVHFPWATRWKKASEDFASDRAEIARAETFVQEARARTQQLTAELEAAKTAETASHAEFRSVIDGAEAKAETLEALLREFRDLR